MKLYTINPGDPGKVPRRILRVQQHLYNGGYARNDDNVPCVTFRVTAANGTRYELSLTNEDVEQIVDARTRYAEYFTQEQT